MDIDGLATPWLSSTGARTVNLEWRRPTVHYERHHLLFYRYRGYIVCLINVGGYGDSPSAIVSRIPMKPSMQIALSAIS